MQGRYEALYRLSRVLHDHHLDTQRIMQTLLTTTGQMIGIEQGFLVTFNEDDHIQDAFILDQPQPASDLWQTLLDRGVIGYVYHGQRTVYIRNVEIDPRWPELPQTLTQMGSAIGLPLWRHGGVFGVLLVLHPEISAFDGETVALLEEIADLGATALNNAWDFGISGKGAIRYETLFDDAVVPILLTDLDGVIVGANRKATDLLECERHDLLLTSIEDVQQVDMTHIGSLNKLRPEEEVTLRASIQTLHTRQAIQVVLRVRRLPFAQGNLIEWMQQDVTAQMELEQLRRDLTAMVYHDLRGPLQAIAGSTQKLAQVLANHENPLVRTLLQIGVRSTRQLRRMLDSLLDLQRLEEGSAILDRQSIEMQVVLTDAVQLVQPLIFDAGQTLDIRISRDLPMIEVDSDMILRVVTNLLENASKYTPEDGKITLSATAQASDIRISVRDSGPGIPPGMQEAIFDKFNRVNYKNAPKGIGLGLAFCRLAIQAHEGCIWVESDGHSGSVFNFTLPLRSAATDDTTEPATSTA